MLRDAHCLLFYDAVIVTRLPDGTFKFDRENYSALAATGTLGLIGFLMGLVVAQPLAGAVIFTLVGSVFSAAAAAVGISDDFVSDVQELMLPGAPVLFLVGNQGGSGSQEAIMYQLRGLGGKVLKSNVDADWEKRIQMVLGDQTPATHA